MAWHRPRAAELQREQQQLEQVRADTRALDTAIQVEGDPDATPEDKAVAARTVADYQAKYERG